MHAINCMGKINLLVALCVAGFVVFVKADALSIDKKFVCKSALDGTRYFVTVTKNDFENVPKWDPTRGTPPVTMSSALAKANLYLDTLGKGANQFELDSVSLQNLRDGDWIYVLKYDPPRWRELPLYKNLITGGIWAENDTPYLFIVVLMNGVIAPRDQTEN